MIGFTHMGINGANGTRALGALLVSVCLTACSGSGMLGSQPDATAPSPPPAPQSEPTASRPPPVDLAGRWQLSAAAGGACFMTFGEQQNGPASATPQGSIAPEGGCPGNFFTSRKWTFEHGMLVIHDFKGRQLAQLSYLGGHFEGQEKNGGALTLSRQQ